MLDGIKAILSDSLLSARQADLLFTAREANQLSKAEAAVAPMSINTQIAKMRLLPDTALFCMEVVRATLTGDKE